MPVIKQSEKTYTPVPPGSHPARCVSMISLGTQAGNNPKFKPSFQVVLGFEFPNEQIEINGEKKPMMVMQFMNAYLGSVSKPSKTNLFLTSWRGRQFTPEELAGFDLAKVVGAPALINIIHEEREGKTREKIASISPLPKGMGMAGAVNEPVIYEIEEGRSDKFKALPEWAQKKIEQCEEWMHPAAAEPSDNDGDNVDPEVGF